VSLVLMTVMASLEVEAEIAPHVRRLMGTRKMIPLGKGFDCSNPKELLKRVGFPKQKNGLHGFPAGPAAKKGRRLLSKAASKKKKAGRMLGEPHGKLTSRQQTALRQIEKLARGSTGLTERETLGQTQRLVRELLSGGGRSLSSSTPPFAVESEVGESNDAAKRRGNRRAARRAARRARMAAKKRAKRVAKLARKAIRAFKRRLAKKKKAARKKKKKAAKKAKRAAKKAKRAAKKKAKRAAKLARKAIRAYKQRLAKKGKAARKRKKAAKKAARKKKKAAKKAKKAVKKKARKAKRKQKRATRKARRAAKRAGKSPATQTLCCPRSKHCFEFCHRNCPSIKVKGIGSIYAQYKLAKQKKRNQNNKRCRGRRRRKCKLRGNIKRAIAGRARSWGSTKPCTTPKPKGDAGMCMNKNLFKKRKAPKNAASFNDEKATLASNSQCVLKWGFKRKVYRKRTAIQEVLLGSSAVVQQEEGSKETLKSELGNLKDFTVDEIFATLCNIKTGVSANAVWNIEGCLTGVCARESAVVNCMRSTSKVFKNEVTRCSMAEVLTYSNLV